MKGKKIKYSISSIVIMLSLILGFVAYAEENDTTNDKPVACTMDAKTCPDGSFVGRVGPDCEFSRCPGLQNREEIRDQNRNEMKKQREAKKQKMEKERELIKADRVLVQNEFKTEIESRREAYKLKMAQLMEISKTKREELKKELDLKKEEAKQKIEAAKINFKENLSKIKDERKKLSALKIVGNLQELNTKRTDQLNEKINQIENVLNSINSRITKSENKIIDSSLLSSKVSLAETAIKEARATVASQITKTYILTTTITDETKLKTEIKKLRDDFSTDIKALHQKVKLAHEAVRNLATELAQIPRVDEDDISDDKVEDNTNTSTN